MGGTTHKTVRRAYRHAQQRAVDHASAVGRGQARGHLADDRRDDRGDTDERCRPDQRWQGRGPRSRRAPACGAVLDS